MEWKCLYVLVCRRDGLRVKERETESGLQDHLGDSERGINGTIA